MNKTMKLIK